MDGCLHWISLFLCWIFDSKGWREDSATEAWLPSAAEAGLLWPGTARLEAVPFQDVWDAQAVLRARFDVRNTLRCTAKLHVAVRRKRAEEIDHEGHGGTRISTESSVVENRGLLGFAK
jgi:hypothetical protein